MPRGAPRGRSTRLRQTVRGHRAALVAAPVVTVLAVGTGVLTSGSGTVEGSASAADTVSSASSASSAQARSDAAARSPEVAATPKAAVESRTLGTSRSSGRVPLVDNRVPRATGKLWTTENLDLRTAPGTGAAKKGLLKAGKQVAVTGRRADGSAEVIVDRTTTRWVTARYLSKKKAPEAMGLSNAPCPDGSDIEGGLQPQSVKVYRAVCAAFPELSAYGGQDGHGEHVNGEAIDFMVPSAATGDKVKDFLYAHRAQLDLFDIIWSQQIWTIQRAGEGFRGMSDRGSATANHFDHVHIKIN